MDRVPPIFRTLEKIRPLYDWTYKILMFVCKLLLIGDIIITCWSVAGRYIPFITDPHWSEEIVLTLMVYMTVLSASMAIRKGAHIRMTAFDRYLPKTVVNVLDVAADIGVIILAIIMIVEGWKFATGIGAKGFYPSLPSLSKRVMYMPIPIAGIAMLIFELESLLNNILKLMGKEQYIPREESIEEKVTEKIEKGGAK